MIGCPGDERRTGSVYYYTLAVLGDQYVPQQKITTVHGALNDNLANSHQIVVDGDIMVVGTDKLTEGTVHIFSKTASSMGSGTFGEKSSRIFTSQRV